MSEHFEHNGVIPAGVPCVVYALRESPHVTLTLDGQRGLFGSTRTLTMTPHDARCLARVLQMAAHVAEHVRRAAAGSEQ